jgi:germination protein M
LPRLKLLVLPLLLIFALTGCSLLWPSVNNTPEQPDPSPYTSGSFMPEIIPTAGEETRLRTVYLLDHANRYLVPYVLGVRRTEGIAREVLQRLVDSPDNAVALVGTEFNLPFPEGTTVLGMTIRDQLAIVDFSEEFLNFKDATHERLAIDSLLYTLTEFENVDRVELRVAGHRVTTLPSGLSLPNPFSRSERPLNLEIASDITDLNQGTKVRLYFSAVGPAGGLIYFVPVTRQILPQNDPLAAVVLELIQGPAVGSGLHADVPVNTELRSIKLEDGIVYVDFSSELVSYGGGTAAENAMLGSLVLSLTDIPGVKGVKITINGQTPMLPEGTDVSQPVTRPIFVNPFIL